MGFPLRILCLTALLTVFWPLSAPVQAQNITCQPTAYRRAVRNTNQGTVCYTVALSKGSTSVRLDLKANGGVYDMYVKAGTATSFTSADKANVQPVKGSLNYILASARSSTYTVAVVRAGSSGTFSLSTATASGTSSSCASKTAALAVGACRNRGDQAVYRADIASGAEAQVSWNRTRRVSASLNGSSKSAQPLTWAGR
jgi:hypothetical protein